MIATRAREEVLQRAHGGDGRRIGECRVPLFEVGVGARGLGTPRPEGILPERGGPGLGHAGQGGFDADPCLEGLLLGGRLRIRGRGQLLHVHVLRQLAQLRIRVQAPIHAVPPTIGARALLLAARQHQQVLGAGEGHVEQAQVFGVLAGLEFGAHRLEAFGGEGVQRVRHPGPQRQAERAFEVGAGRRGAPAASHAGHHHHGPLQALGAVDGQQLHGARVAFVQQVRLRLVGVGVRQLAQLAREGHAAARPPLVPPGRQGQQLLHVGARLLRVRRARQRLAVARRLQGRVQQRVHAQAVPLTPQHRDEVQEARQPGLLARGHRGAHVRVHQAR
ncbi:hypothetical protein COSO111634_13445 [Corallococcus soli]